ncbi:MAG: PilZ domain-containing protein [Oryzomonas sp.]|uniref:PilZ domain-containing protein n=1 Tax=Oryzomonas sp. TaxID=2855186 RepID=UPI00284FABDA|nr:PilZ domain-containing protein [Oryzomonas sp.]MDR3579267.1 PilZ domain-containing protein [Oryzomonas sp.]
MDPNSIYSSRVVRSFEEDQAEILATLKNALAGKKLPAFKLINYFKGLPLTYAATLDAVEHGILDLDVQPQQAVAMAADHYTLIRCKLFPHDIAAHVQYVNVPRHAVSLSKLRFVEIMAERRSSVRLDLAHPTQAAFPFQGQDMHGRLSDISTGGAAINTDEYLDMPTGNETILRFLLPDPTQDKLLPLKVEAKLVHIEGHASPYSYRFAIHPEKLLEQQLSRYIFQRQIEIIRDLKDAAA